MPGLIGARLRASIIVPLPQSSSTSGVTAGRRRILALEPIVRSREQPVGAQI
jgi:hypothetical protein